MFVNDGNDVCVAQSFAKNVRKKRFSLSSFPLSIFLHLSPCPIRWNALYGETTRAQKREHALLANRSRSHLYSLVQFGLYGERVGCFSFVGENKEEADRILSQVRTDIRQH